MRIGILALQGAVEPHRRKLTALGAEGVPVRTAAELAGCDGLILPGGESTTLLKLIGTYGLERPLRDFAAGRPVWGVCAGSILMAERVENPAQPSLGLVPLTVRRNAYGRQNESFIAPIRVSLPGATPQVVDGVFIRAPRIAAITDDALLLAEHEGVPISVQHGHHLLTTFHPELAAADLFHRHFLDICGANGARQAHSA